MNRKGQKALTSFAVLAALFVASCATATVPSARNVNIPSPTMADTRKQAINERPDSIMYLPLGEDVLVPEMAGVDEFPDEVVGPFELRGETLAGALQLILSDYDISLAFETQEGLTRRITVANLKGNLGKVVHQVCSLANLYCAYEDGTITIKDRQTFTVTLPPLGSGDDASAFLEDVASGLGAILNEGSTSSGTTTSEPIVDPTTRTIVYTATQRTADIASRYFQRLRANTAMIVFETYIWEVSLNSGNSMGIDWTRLFEIGKFNTGIKIDGTIAADFTNPVSIGLPTQSDTFNGTTGDLIQFLSQFGAVKTISQPQITVLSGSEAELRVADTQNYVSQIATTLSEGQATTSVNTDSVDTGFTLTISSSWDKSTVYAGVEIELTDVKQIDDFAFSDDSTVEDDPATPEDESEAAGSQTRIQLPQTSERQLSTQIRVRPGDSVLIAGLVRENDNFDKSGPGLMEPILPDSRTVQTQNLELVILLRPRVIVYTAANDKRYIDYAIKKHKLPGTGVEVTSPKELGEPAEYTNRYVAPTSRAVVSEQENIPGGMPAPLTQEPVMSPVSSEEPVPVMKPVMTPPPVVKPVPPPVPAAKPVMVEPAPAPAPTPAPAPAPVTKTTPVPVTSAPPPPPSSTLTAPPSKVSESLDLEKAPPPTADRFRRGTGFTSSEYAPAASAPAPAPSAGTAPVYPSEDHVPATNSGPDTTVSPAQPAPTSPVYETYDEYSASP